MPVFFKTTKHFDMWFMSCLFPVKLAQACFYQMWLSDLNCLVVSRGFFHLINAKCLMSGSLYIKTVHWHKGWLDGVSAWEDGFENWCLRNLHLQYYTLSPLNIFGCLRSYFLPVIVFLFLCKHAVFHYNESPMKAVWINFQCSDASMMTTF